MRRDYTKTADSYDDERFSDSNGEFLNRTDGTIIRELFQLTNARQVLDIPTGTGRVAGYLESEDILLIGCDLTQAMLNHARSKNVQCSPKYLAGDASTLPFRDGSIQCIISLRFFHLFPPQDRYAFVKEFARVLVPGGYLICSFTNGWYAGGVNHLRRLLGYRTVHFQNFKEIRRLFTNWHCHAIRGNFVPFEYHISKLGAGAEHAAVWCTSKWPLNRLCWERFYLLQKLH
jgi:ubiquinone/menaquinone biosynthesis C-methylase UbiE